MKRLSHFSFLVLASLSLGCGILRADQADDDRLRATLRSTMQQLQDAQNQLATLQAQQSENADEKKAAADQAALLQKRLVQSQSESDRKIAELRSKAASQAAEIERLTQLNADWKAAQEKTVAEARTVAADRDRQQNANVLLQRRVDDLKTKNLALYDLSNQILNRFEKYGMGEQFMAKEPFIGRSRVRLENLVQDYSDKIQEQMAEK